MTDDEPRNAMLDLFERHVEALRDLGCEAQMRTRLARLLPDGKAAPAAAPTVVEVPVDHTGPMIWLEIIGLMKRARLTAHESIRRDELVAHAQAQIGAATRPRADAQCASEAPSKKAAASAPGQNQQRRSA